MYWQWLHFLQCRTPASKPVLMLNLDETCLRFPAKPPRGVVARCQKQSLRSMPLRPMGRGSITLVVVLCENQAVQRSLPSFLLCNTHVLPHALYQHLVAAAPNALRILRLSSSWNTADAMCLILDEVAKALTPWKEFCQPVLTLDVAPCHTAHKVLLKARTLQVFLGFIPPGLTSKLQVADVFCFRAMKAWWLRQLQKLQEQHGEISKISWFELFLKFPAWLQSREWKAAFEATCALNGDETALTKELQKLSLQPGAHKSMPTEEQIICLLPKRRSIKTIYSLLFIQDLQ